MRRNKRLELPPAGDLAMTNGRILAPLMASLSLLLIAFFILFYSMSMISERKKAIALGSLQGSFGYLDGGRVATMEKNELPLLDQAVIKERAAALRKRLTDYLRRRGIREAGIEVTALERGYRIGLPWRLLFAPGGIRLTAAGRQLLLRTVRLFRVVPDVSACLIAYLQPASREAVRVGISPLALAALRAGRCYHYLVLDGGLPADRLQAGGRLAGGKGGERLDLELYGAEPAFDVRGRQRPFKIGDYTFQ